MIVYTKTISKKECKGLNTISRKKKTPKMLFYSSVNKKPVFNESTNYEFPP
ncbi:MAG: hypothetical protein K0S53_2695 [Bacteroidetes bacterium]|jgi:hypothetical protein|nr:hypothetical protein [Bacteroidota bacterium]